MADHYKVLGLSKNATKAQIKHAFRKLAVQFHPDKHSQSPKSTKDAATLKFKQVSEAYEVLADDRKRAAYNVVNNTANYHNNSYTNQNYRNSSYTHQNYRRGGGNGGGGSFYRGPASSKRMLLGGIAAIDISRETLWKIHNPGKSFEEALESIDKNKARKDKQ